MSVRKPERTRRAAYGSQLPQRSSRPSWASTMTVEPVPASTAYRRTPSAVRSHSGVADSPSVVPHAVRSAGGR
jgi:hypothetical protein